MVSDGVPDVSRGGKTDYDSIVLTPLERLARSVTVRLLYAEPTVAQKWERYVTRRRVRLWTQESEVMLGWRRHSEESPDSLWSWMSNIVDFRVRRGRVI